MTPATFITHIMRPSAAWCAQVAGLPSSPASDQFLLTVAMQESNLEHRAQVSRGMEAGPARGWWQFEKGGGVHGVLIRHPVSRDRAKQLCAAAFVHPNAAAAWRAIEGHDGLAYGFARLLLLTDPYAIPTAPEPAWRCYLERLWRPGAPHHDVWPSNWRRAEAALAAGRAIPLVEPRQ